MEETKKCPECGKETPVKTNKKNQRYYRCVCGSWGLLPKNAKTTTPNDKPTQQQPPNTDKEPAAAAATGDSGKKRWWDRELL